MIHYRIPWATDKNIGKAYNSAMELLPHDDDFACFIDADAMFLTPFFGKQLEDVVAKHSTCGIFTCLTNRIGCRWQKAGDHISNDIAQHRAYAKQLFDEQYDTTEIIPQDGKNLLGGVLILIKKSTWKKIGGFKDGLLGVDNELQLSAENAQEEIRLMKGVFIYHWYRGGRQSDKDHLKTDQVFTRSEELQNIMRTGTKYKRTEIMNKWIDEKGYVCYLEIGVQNPLNNFNHIKAVFKTSVDPDPNAQAHITMGSDEFFAQNEQMYHIVFIDGLHHADQVERDIENSLKFLVDGGAIFVHDVLPTSKEMQIVPRETKQWTGDVWKAIVKYRNRPDLTIKIYNVETGLAVITKEPSVVPTTLDTNCTWEEYDKMKGYWFDII